MKLIENMTLSELKADRETQLRRIKTAETALEKIHGKKDFSDEIAKHFHLGKVGFRKDTKKQNETLNRAIDNGVKACGYYNIIEEAKNRVHAINKAENIILKNKNFGETVRQIRECKNKAAVKSIKPLEWEKVSGHYGTAYKHKDFIVERVDAGFVAVRDTNGNLLSHYKTVKEAKANVALMIVRNV